MAVTTERKQRIKRERTSELAKIEIYKNDVQDVEIDVKILNKLSRKLGRHSRRR